MLISGKLGLRNALENGYALPAFNYTNLEGIKAIIEAAEEMNSPVIIQVTQGAIDYAGFEYLRDLGTGAAARSKVPVVLHLDHGKDYNYLLKAFRYGWTSLMMDASHESFEKNVDDLSKASLVYLMDRKINYDGDFEKEILAAYKGKYCKTPSKYAVIGFDVMNDMLTRENKKGEIYHDIINRNCSRNRSINRYWSRYRYRSCNI